MRLAEGKKEQRQRRKQEEEHSLPLRVGVSCYMLGCPCCHGNRGSFPAWQRQTNAKLMCSVLTERTLTLLEADSRDCGPPEK